MTSRLPSLLVRDGLIRAARMEKVFERQVLRGGALDTILLEMQLVEDHRLQQYLSLATGLPAVQGGIKLDNREELIGACSYEQSCKYGCVPFKLIDDGIRVLVCDPVEVDKLESLADEIDQSVQPMVVPEYRYHLTQKRLYGEDIDPRFAALEASAGPQPVEEVPVSESAIPEAIAPENTEPADTSERVRGTRPPAEQPARRQTQDIESEAQQTESSEAAQEKPSAPSSDSLSALTPDEARALLATADERDDIFIALLRALRKRSLFTFFFTVKGQQAKGLLALSKAHGLEREEVKDISIPLDRPSQFQRVVQTKAFSVGDLETQDADLSAALAKLGGGTIPRAALLLPIILRDRLIAIAVAHNGEHPLQVARMTEMLPLGTATSDALSRLLAQKKSSPKKKAGSKESSKKESKGEAAADDKNGVSSEGKSADSAGEGFGAATVESSPEVIELFERLESAEGEAFEAACKEALERRKEVLHHLEKVFPGKLTKEREADGPACDPKEHGPILDLVSRLGDDVGPLLSEEMRHADREHRYYATLCATRLRPPGVINQFVERLFDGDESIRDLAVEALREYPEDERREALEFARRALHSEDNARAKLAAEGLCRLADAASIPDLIDAHSRGGDAANLSRTALFQLTCQDFGSSTRKWRGWWESNQERHPIEWMLEGLRHKKVEIRRNAEERLRDMTGEFFGYAHDLPKKERDKKTKLWQQWWTDSGRGKFLGDRSKSA